MSDPAISCTGLSKRFVRGERHDSLRDAVPQLVRWLRGQGNPADERAFWALRDVSFDLPRGEALGVIGPNGAGKSTLLKLLSRIMVPDDGNITVDGRLTALIEVGAGFHQDLTGRENIYLNGAILGMTRREIDRTIGDIGEFAGVQDFLDTPVKRYSSGMQARLGFSVAAHMDPEILLVDEVLAVGDAQFQQRCLERMHYFAHSGRSIIFISHDLQAVAELCPHTMVLLKGERAFLGPTAEALRFYMEHMRDQPVDAAAGATTINNVRLLDDHGVPCDRYRAGSRADLNFDITTELPANDYILSFAIKRATDGLIVSDYNFDIPGAREPCVDRAVKIGFDANLLTGAYAITLCLEHRATLEKIVVMDGARIFDVAAREAYSGIAHVNPSIAETAAHHVCDPLTTTD